MYELYYKANEDELHILYKTNDYPHLWLLAFNNQGSIKCSQFIDNLINIASTINDDLFTSEIANFIATLTEFGSETLQINGNVQGQQANVELLKSNVIEYRYDQIFGDFVNMTSFVPHSNSQEYFKKYKTQYKREYSVFNSLTNILIIINVAVFAFNYIFGYSELQFIIAQSEQNIAMIILSIFTAGFTHASLMHVGFNMLFLHSIGPVLEHLLGKKKFIILYMLSMLTSGVFVYLFSQPLSATVGASGALYGLFAFFILYVLRYSTSKETIRNVVTTFAINVLITFTISGISMSGHIGGMVFGAIYFFILEQFFKK